MNSDSVLEEIARDYLKEKKRQRRFKYFKWLVLFMVVIVLAYFAHSKNKVTTDNAALIDIEGPIFFESDASADNLHKSLKSAFTSPSTKAVILRINSPGGSPVEADLIYQEVMRYRKEYPKKPVYAVCGTLCASAAYYIAASADEIYANPASLVGSIGVLYNGFGFVDALQKLGIQRRLVTAGKQKGFLDPFSAEKPEQVQELKTMLEVIHQQFIERVKQGRGKKLTVNAQTFSGRVWTGEQAKSLGLIDAYGGMWDIVRDKLKLEQVVDHSYHGGFAQKLMHELGSSASLQFMSYIQMHAIN